MDTPRSTGHVKAACLRVPRERRPEGRDLVTSGQLSELKASSRKNQNPSETVSGVQCSIRFDSKRCSDLAGSQDDTLVSESGKALPPCATAGAHGSDDPLAPERKPVAFVMFLLWILPTPLPELRNGVFCSDSSLGSARVWIFLQKPQPCVRPGNSGLAANSITDPETTACLV